MSLLPNDVGTTPAICHMSFDVKESTLCRVVSVNTPNVSLCELIFLLIILVFIAEAMLFREAATRRHKLIERKN